MKARAVLSPEMACLMSACLGPGPIVAQYL